jgi:uncharacterized protein YajQ (UPF0234 family)
MPSFDIVSRVDLAEVDNALNALTREIGQRFDFKGSKSSVERSESDLTVIADDDGKLKEVHELLKAHFVRRKIDGRVLDFQTPEKASQNTLRQVVKLRQGVAGDLAKQIVKIVKESKIKVQVAIQGDEMRVTGKKRDDLQNAIALIRASKIDQPLQFVNMRD